MEGTKIHFGLNTCARVFVFVVVVAVNDRLLAGKLGTC
jgi:hypothetical protein